jgi:hypothetical protein
MFSSFSSAPFLKDKRKQVNYFLNILYLTQHIQNTITSTYNQCKKISHINETTLLFLLSHQSPVYWTFAEYLSLNSPISSVPAFEGLV